VQTERPLVGLGVIMSEPRRSAPEAIPDERRAPQAANSASMQGFGPLGASSRPLGA